jgi:hypothetical protein
MWSTNLTLLLKQVVLAILDAMVSSKDVPLVVLKRLPEDPLEFVVHQNVLAGFVV